MGYKWKPSASQRKAFAAKMQDPTERAEYEQRKATRADRRRFGSKFDYNSAGGMYVPTQNQYDCAMRYLQTKELTHEQQEACNMVMSAYSCQDKVHHDYIHIVNELVRSNPL